MLSQSRLSSKMVLFLCKAVILACIKQLVCKKTIDIAKFYTEARASAVRLTLTVAPLLRRGFENSYLQHFCHETPLYFKIMVTVIDILIKGLSVFKLFISLRDSDKLRLLRNVTFVPEYAFYNCDCVIKEKNTYASFI